MMPSGEPLTGSASMATPTEVEAIEPDLAKAPSIITATRFEYLLTRLAARRNRVIHAGMRLERLGEAPKPGGPVILCGLAGSLISDLKPGMVLVPSQVFDTDGSLFDCDPRLVELLRLSARQRGFDPIDGNLLTATHIVTGDERAVWAERGFEAVDMEAALLGRMGVPFATVRVILDSPSRSLSERWAHPTRALPRWYSYVELPWLATAAPRYALRAARIAAAAIART